MKKLIFLILLIPLSVMAQETKKDPNSIEVIEGKTDRPFTLISPISTNKNSEEAAFKQLKEKAAKMDADAIIEYDCTAQQTARGGGLLFGGGGFGHRIKSQAACQGKAIKWISKQ